MSDQATQTIFPALRYKDADVAIEFLCKAFGFEEHAVYREGGVVVHAQLQLGEAIVMLGTYTEEGWLGGSAPTPYGSTVSIYVVVADPDSHHERAAGAGANIVRPLTDEDYGSREYSARDPEGNLWSFGTYNPHAAA